MALNNIRFLEQIIDGNADTFRKYQAANDYR
jgi:hypothetical protein